MDIPASSELNINIKLILIMENALKSISLKINRPDSRNSKNRKNDKVSLQRLIKD